MKKTGVFCLTVMIIMGIWDGFSVLNHGTTTSISRWVIETGYYSPFFTFLFGALIGHLFLSMPEPILFMNKDLDNMLKVVDDINICSPKDLEAKNELYRLVSEIKRKRNRTGKIC